MNKNKTLIRNINPKRNPRHKLIKKKIQYIQKFGKEKSIKSMSSSPKNNRNKNSYI